jgi:glycosyltransferase involved in cell wall biosynthesis
VKILHVAHLYYPSIGGTERHTHELSIELQEMGHRVWIFTTDVANLEGMVKGRDYLEETSFYDSGLPVSRFHVVNSPILRSILRGIFVVSCSIRKIGVAKKDTFVFSDALFYSPITPKLYFTMAQSNEFDIVNSTPHPFGYNYLLGKICRRKRIPFIVTPRTHAFNPLYQSPYLIKTAQEADAVIVFTEFEKDFYVERGVSADRIFITGIGITPEEYHDADSTSFMIEHGIPNRSKIVIHIGRMEKYKGLPLLIKSMKEVWKSAPETYLVIIGKSTSHTSEIERIIKKEERIVLLPDASDKTKIDALSSSNLLVLPSKLESFGAVFLEAWALAKPVIGARTPVIESIIDEGQDGLLLNNLEAGELAKDILFLLKNEDAAKEMGRKGQEKVLRDYTWKEIAQKTMKVYESVIEQS